MSGWWEERKREGEGRKRERKREEEREEEREREGVKSWVAYLPVGRESPFAVFVLVPDFNLLV